MPIIHIFVVLIVVGSFSVKPLMEEKGTTIESAL